MITAVFSRLRHLATESSRLRRAGVGLAFLGASALVSVSIFATAPDSTLEIKQERAWPVSVMQIAPRPLSPMFNSYGRVESTRQSRIRTNLSAEIVTVRAREGQWVKAGDVLVELRRDELELAVIERAADLDQERAQLASTRTEFQMTGQLTEHFSAMNRIAQTKLARHQDLVKRRMISQALLDEVIQQASAASIEYQNHLRALADYPNRIAAHDARIVRAESKLAQARIDLDNATITAPFSGPIIAVAASPGDYSVTGAVLVEVADAEGFEIRAPIPDSYRARIRDCLASGEPVIAAAPVDGNGREFALARVASNVRTGHSGIDAFFRIAIQPGEAPPEIGRVLNLVVTLPPEADVVALPVQSIYENDRIYEVADNRLQALTVERIGDYQSATGEYRILVRSPELTPGRQILTTQLPKAISGLLVAPVEAGSS